MEHKATLIGRVGGLAIAAGIGAALANNLATAAADTQADTATSATDAAGPVHDESARAPSPDSANGTAIATPDVGEPGDVAQATTTARRTRASAPRRPVVRAQQTVIHMPKAEAVPAPKRGNPRPAGDDPAALAALGVARRELGHDRGVVQASSQQDVSHTAANVVAASSPLGTPQQLAAEKLATRTARTLPVQLMKLVLRAGFLSAAQQQFPSVRGPDRANLDRLDDAVDAYAMAAAFQQQLLNSNRPTVVMQVAPPHEWYGQDVAASRILYDNPDTVYRFMGVNGASSYTITGRFADIDNLPADTTFSVLTGLTGNTASVLTKDQLVFDSDGKFTITADSRPANGRVNHLQLPAGATLIATRNTLSDWSLQTPMSLEITRVGGPRDSLFSQLGGFAIPGIGPTVVRSPLLTHLVSFVPPLPHVPPVVRGVVTAVIMALGIQREAQYMAVATTDPETGSRIAPNVLRSPARNAEFLATQLQSAGYFQLDDGQALVLTIDPDGAGYFVVPVTDDWTVTKDYWNEQTSLNIAQADENDDGTFTFVISPTDPHVANWVSTGGLNQGTLSIRFQDLRSDTAPTVSYRVVSLDELGAVLPPETDILTDDERIARMAARKNGFDKRFAPFPQP